MLTVAAMASTAAAYACYSITYAYDRRLCFFLRQQDASVCKTLENKAPRLGKAQL